MTNRVDKTVPGLLTSAGDAANAAATHGATIGLLQNPAAKIRPEIDGLRVSVNRVDALKSGLVPLRLNMRGLVSQGRELLIVARDNFKPLLGSEYNEAWDPTGLVDSLSIPDVTPGVQSLLGSFHDFLVANPGQEVPSKNVTAQEFETLFTSLDAARSSVREQEVLLDNARRERDAKALALRKRMRSLIDELNMLLDPMDARWKAFGFNVPGAPETPDVPENVVATLIGPTAVAVKWNAPPRAEYFRVWKRVIGVDQESVAVGNPADVDFTIEGLPSNATVEVVVSAVNEGGESNVSKVVTVKTG
jgi:hypothetical protein